jgi:hypothetical protein
VFAQAAADRPCRFIRVMILPRTLLGKSSIQYVNKDDKAKPKSQQYRALVDAPIKHDPADLAFHIIAVWATRFLLARVDGGDRTSRVPNDRSGSMLSKKSFWIVGLKF